MKIRHNFFFFWETRSPFSQWHPVGFTIDGIHFKTAEHYMMWSKAMLFNDENAAEKVLKTKHPKDVKAIGREVRNFNSEKWDAVCKDVVYKGNYAKFTQNAEMMRYLLNTGDREMVEASPYDKIWGIGLGESDPRAFNKETWQGLNYLGEVLTKVREDIKNGR